MSIRLGPMRQVGYVVRDIEQAMYRDFLQHVRLARQIGVTQEEIDRIGVDGPVQGLDEESVLLCRVAEEISRGIRLSDEALEAILKRHGVLQATELILCCSYFNMLRRFLESTRVELESTPAF